jgi:hypothetical protein
MIMSSEAVTTPFDANSNGNRSRVADAPQVELEIAGDAEPSDAAIAH